MLFQPGSLMLAPMRGLTNRALRAFFVDRFQPDLLWTEFLVVGARARRNLRPVERDEVQAHVGVAPLVVQLIGDRAAALARTGSQLVAVGATHLNLNLGCPYGRRAAKRGGGALLRDPSPLPEILRELRAVTPGTLSVKLRSGYEDPRQIFGLLPIFEDTGIDFLALHPRTVVQLFAGRADHRITAEVVQRTRLPVIANGDVRTAAEARRVLAETGAASLMLGRGAIADPWLFARIRGEADEVPSPEDRARQVQEYLGDLLGRYRSIFAGNDQVLWKLKEVLAYLEDPALARLVGKMKRARSLARFESLLARLGPDSTPRPG